MFRSFQRSLVQVASTGILVVGAVEVTTHLPSQGRSSETYHKISDEIVTPLIRRWFNPEGEFIYVSIVSLFIYRKNSFIQVQMLTI